MADTDKRKIYTHGHGCVCGRAGVLMSRRSRGYTTEYWATVKHPSSGAEHDVHVYQDADGYYRMEAA